MKSVDPETLPIFPAGRIGRTHLFDDHYREITKCVAWHVKMQPYRFIGEFMIFFILGVSMTTVGRCTYSQFADRGLFNNYINNDQTAFCARAVFDSINCNIKYNNSYKF